MLYFKQSSVLYKRIMQITHNWAMAQLWVLRDFSEMEVLGTGDF